MLRLPVSRGRGDQEAFAAFWQPFEAEMRAGCATRQFSTGGDYRRLIYRFLTGAALGSFGFLAGCGSWDFSASSRARLLGVPLPGRLWGWDFSASSRARLLGVPLPGRLWGWDFFRLRDC